MGTFHADRGELHGVTVVVEAHGSRTWVGRCDTVTEEGVLLRGADVHEGEAGADLPQDAWLERVAKLGVWPRHDRIRVPAGDVASIRRLSAIG